MQLGGRCKIRLFLALFFTLSFIALAYADTVYLKNGRTIAGIIKSENNDTVELEISGGVIKLNKAEIDKIKRASSANADLLRQKWEEQKKEVQEKISQQKLEQERKPRQVEIATVNQSIIVGALLNKKVECSLILDTGASVIMLRKGVAAELGIKLERIKPDAKLQLAYGRSVGGKYIVLESIKVENVEAKNVDAVILLDDVGDYQMRDGLLGMSFLKRFNFKIDQREKRLILEKL